MSKRFGKKRVPDCRCEYNFTCHACLAAAPPWLFTPVRESFLEYCKRLSKED